MVVAGTLVVALVALAVAAHTAVALVAAAAIDLAVDWGSFALI